VARFSAPPIANPSTYKTRRTVRIGARLSDEVIANATKLGMDAIITVGGDGSQKIALELFHKE